MILETLTPEERAVAKKAVLASADLVGRDRRNELARRCGYMPAWQVHAERLAAQLRDMSKIFDSSN
jgi:hypothetical protein